MKMKDIMKMIIVDEENIFLKKEYISSKTTGRTLLSFREEPSLLSTWKRFMKRNNIVDSEYIRYNTGIRNNSNKILYKFEYIGDLSKIKNIQLSNYKLSKSTDSDGYHVVSIKRKTYKAHRIILAYNTIDYMDNYEYYDKLQVNHINGNKKDNRLINLEWSTSKENIRHAWDNNLSERKQLTNTKSSIAKLKNNDISYIFTSKCSERKYSLFQKLKRRGMDVNEYEFVHNSTLKKEGNRKLGYLIKKSI